jgi:hypothetical protein
MLFQARQKTYTVTYFNLLERLKPYTLPFPPLTDSEESWLQCGAESVAIHDANLCIGRLVAQEVFFGWYHVLEDLFVWLHHLCHCFVLDACQDLQRMHCLGQNITA